MPADLAQLWGLSGQLYGGATPTDPQAALQAALRYDPNAHLESYSDFGDSGGGMQQQLIFDRSKLPAPQVQGLVPYIGNPNNPGPSTLANPNALFNDPNYGPMTAQANIRSRNDTTWLDTVGPLVVGGAIGLGGGFSMLGNLLSKLPNVAQMASGFMNRAPAISPQQLYLMQLLSRR